MASDGTETNSSNSSVTFPDLPTSLLDSLADNLVILNPDGVIVASNEAWREFGRENNFVEAPDMLGTNYLDVTRDIHDPKGEEATDGIRSVINGERETFEMDYPCHSPDTRRWFNMRVAPFDHDGGSYVTVTHTEITERKLREIELKEQAEFLDTINDRMPGIAYQFKASPDGDYSFSYLSDGYEELTGVPTEEAMRDFENAIRTVHPDDLEPTLASIQEAVDNENTWKQETRFQLPGGDQKWLMASGRPKKQDDGSLVFSGVIIDITEQKELEEELRESEELHRATLNNITDTVFITDDDGQFTYVCPNINYIFGHSAEHVRELGSVQALLEEDPAPESLGENGTVDNLERVITDAEGKEHSVLISVKSVSIQGGTRLYTLRDVTKIAEYREKLARKNQRQELAQKIANLGHWSVTIPEEEILWSDETYRIFGLDPSENNMSLEEGLEYYHPDDRERPRRLLEESVQNCEEVSFEARVKRPDGEIRHIDVYGIPQTNEEGSVTELFGVVQDITEQKQREDELERSRELLHQTEKLANTGGWEADVETGEQRWTQGTYHIHDLEPHETDLTVVNGIEFYHPDDQPEIKRVVRRCMEEGGSFDVELRLITAEDRLRWVNATGQPVYEDGQIVAVRGAIQDITDYKKTQQSLKKSEKRFRQMAETIEDVFWLSDPEKDLLYVSPAFEDIWGIPVEELYEDTQAFVERIHPEDRERVREAMYKDQLTGDYDEEFRIIRPDGETRWIRDRAFPVDAEGVDGKRVAGIAEDITERKHRKQDLSLKNRMIEEAPIGISMIDPDWQDNPIVYVNESFVDLTGYGEEELLGNSHRMLKGEKSDPETVSKIREAIDAGESCSVEILDYRKDGSTFWNHVTLAPVRDEEGTITHYVRFNQDVSEWKETQQNLRETEKRFRQLTENIDEVFWISDPDTEEMIYVSPAYQRVWGRSLQSLYDEPQSFLEAIHPEDRDQVEAVIPNQRSGEYDLKYRVQQPDGEIRWVRDRAFPVRDEQGEAHRIVGIAEDMTEMKKLQREREKFVQVVEHSRSCIIRANLDRKITYVNPAGLEMLGVEELDELQGEHLKTIHPEEDYGKYEEAISTVTQGGLWHGERQYLNQSTGEVVDVLFDGFRIFDPETDKPIEYASVATDISEQIEIEEQLRSMVQEKETLLQEVHHRVKNNLQVVLGLLGLQARQLESEEAQGALRDSERRIQSMAMIHEKLYEGAQLSSIDFDDYVGDLLDKIAESHHEQQEDLELVTNIEPSNLDADTIISCGLIINELVSNSLQHGSDGDSSPRVRVEFHTDDQLNGYLTVADNGRGIEPEKIDEMESLGMRLVRNLAKNQLHGELSYSGDDGLEVEVVFPPAEARHE